MQKYFCKEAPEEQQHRLREGLEVVVAVDWRTVLHGHFAKGLKGKESTLRAMPRCHEQIPAAESL